MSREREREEARKNFESITTTIKKNLIEQNNRFKKTRKTNILIIS